MGTAHLFEEWWAVPTLQSAMSELLLIFVLLIPGLSMLGVMAYLFISILNKRSKVIGRCRGCRYDLRGLGDIRRCPECGQPFEVDVRGNAVS